MAQISRENFNFTSEFQDLVLACVLKRPEFVRYSSVISPKFFTGVVAKLTARAIFAHHQKRRVFPTKEVLIQLVADEAKKIGDEGKELRDYADKLFKIKTLTVWEDVHERVVKFCRERAVLIAIKTCVDAFKKGEEPEGGNVKLFEGAMAVGVDLDELESLKFDANAVHEKPDPVLTLAGHTLLTPGNLGVIAGLPKVGKSAAITAILGALIAPPDGTPRDLLGFAGHNPARGAVLHLDTEQSRFDHAALAQRALWRAGLRKSKCLHSYGVAGLDLKARLSAMRNKARELAANHGLLAIVIDGVGDLCADPNDSKEAFALVDELHRLAAKYDTVIIGVLHENPPGKGESYGKTRGHLGSQLERKSESNLRLKKNADGITVMFTEKSRHAHIPESCGPCFRWDDEAAIHVACASPREAKSDAKAQELRELAADVLKADDDGPARLRNKDLVSRIRDHEGCSKRTADSRIEALVKAGLVNKRPDGTYITGES